MPKYYSFKWTLPNLHAHYLKGGIRGTLNRREHDSRKLNLSRIEVPFDLVREEDGESEELGKEVGETLSRSDFSILYGNPLVELKSEYVVHTDPELKPGHTLKWNKPSWRRKHFIALIDFFDFVGKPPMAIELHSGVAEKSKEYMVTAVCDLIDEIKERDTIFLISS